MHIKIYFDHKPLFLCDHIDDELQVYIHHDDAVFIDELNSHTIKSMIHEMQQPGIHAGVFYHNDLTELKRSFFKKFSFIQASGGVAENERKQILIIYRRKHWDLPKGKLERNESLETCAIREIEEETGLKNITVIKPLMVTYHTYHEGTRFILKESHWFHLKVAGKQNLVPQTEEDIEEIKFINVSDIGKYTPLAFPSVADVLNAFGK
jgi:8-oxo-dGTP pyrophosphatase MutT (NUDIX family)